MFRPLHWARAETCSLNNKYYTTLLVVFRLSTLYHLIAQFNLVLGTILTMRKETLFEHQCCALSFIFHCHIHLVNL